MQFITTYLTANPDPQRGVKWEPKVDKLKPLMDSLLGRKLTVIHDEPLDRDLTCESVLVKPLGNPYFARWEHILNHLPTEGRICLLDATDTEVLCVPSYVSCSGIFVGHEQSVVGNQWMLDNFYTSYMKPFLDHYHDCQLLNCGVVIGHVGIIREFLWRMIAESKNDVGVMEMGIFNKVMYERFQGRFEYGNHVTTQFKKYETSNQTAWIRHK